MNARAHSQNKRKGNGRPDETRATAARPSTKRCAIYTRKSPSARGLDLAFTSLDAQREAGELYVRSQAASGWVVLPTRYDDKGFTGANTDRPALARLLEDIERKKVDIIVVAKVDRLCRSLIDFARLMEILERHDVGFVSITQNFDTSTSMGRLVLNILMSFAEFERAMIAERTRDKIVASRRHGKWTGGAVPFGYRVVDKKLVPEAGTAETVRRIFELKERPADHPVIVHLDNPKYLHRWASTVPENAQKLAARFWPGPLTMVLPRSENVHDVVTGGQDTVAIRVPSHPMAQQLLTAFGGGIAAPSANRFGRVSPTRAEHVREEFGDAVRVVLDGGEAQIGLESTIVSFDGEQVRLLRPGFITYSQLKDVVGDVIVGAGASTPRVPGAKTAHYAPLTPMTIVPVDEIDKRAETLSEGGRRVAVLAMRLPLKTYPSVTWINAGRRPDSYAHDLYSNLRALDKAGCEQILVQDVPSEEKWTAIRDRLARGAAMGAAAAEPDQFTETGGYSVLP